MNMSLTNDVLQRALAIDHDWSLRDVLDRHQLRAVFQPVVRLDDGRVHAHEALIRGPEGSPLESPAALFAQAKAQGLVYELELACLEAVLKRWGHLRERGRLFVNLSPETLVRLMAQQDSAFITRALNRWGLLARQLVVELTEDGQMPGLDVLLQAVTCLRRFGIAVALDDFGQGATNLRMWAELHPEVVKIDKYFVQNVAHDADKADTVRALQRVAEVFGSELVAEGIETESDLRLLRDMGLTFGQGFLLGRPQAASVSGLLPDALSVLESNQVAISPPSRSVSVTHLSQHLEVIQVPGVSPQTACEKVAALFQAQPELHAVALVEGPRPVGLINRLHFLNEYSKKFYRDLWGRKPCEHFANPAPRVVEIRQRVDELMGILTSDDQRYLSDGFIVVEDGRYLGLCRGDQIVKAVTETRIEAARHANPLTFLPGNIPITQHIERLLQRGSEFVLCYLDLNHFKSFNDRYGYWRGDEMIRLVATVARDHVQPQRDFLGHVGGDDFVVIYQSANWQAQCLRMIEQFNARAVGLFDPQDQAKGGIDIEDRQGVPRFFPLTSLSIGAVSVTAGDFQSASEVANAAAAAKHEAKSSFIGLTCFAHQRAAQRPSEATVI